MCGIAGYFGNSKNELEHLKKYGIDSIKHRGPDSHGIMHWEDQNCLFLHTRLAIRDLSQTGAQPMTSKDGRYTIVYNGELYNTETVKEKFLGSQYSLRGSADTEVILESFAMHGIKILKDLNGIFAFALRDNLSNQIYLFRDPMGVKPLYYIYKNNNFAFSSEMKTLLSSNLTEKNININAAKCHVRFMWSPGEETIVSDIKKLLPGHGIIINNKKEIKKIQYKTFKPSLEKIRGKESDIIDECKEKIEKAVKRQLVSDVPVGFFLSGGVDSSAIVSMSKNILKERLECFTIHDDELNEKSKDGFTGDYKYAKIMADYLDVNLNTISTKNTISQDLEKMIYFMDEPNGDPACLNTYFIAEHAKKMGISVLLGGTGADDIFTGYRRHTALKLDDYINYIPKKLRGYLSKSSSYLDTRNVNQRRVKKYLDNIQNDDHQRIINYFNWLEKDIVSNLFIDKSTQYDGEIYSSINALPDETKKLDKMLHIERLHFLADHNLNYSDKMGMAHGVEIRVPYLDHDLVEFALKAPHQLLQKKYSNKWLLKESMKDYIPKSIMNRPKTGFGVPLREWLSTDLLDLKNDLLSNDQLKKDGIFDPISVTKLIEDDADGYIDGTYSIFAIMCINLWTRKFM